MFADPISVMVVDDNAVVREALVGLLERASGIVVCAEAGDLAEAERVAAAVEPDVVVIDLHIGGATSIEAGRRIREARPGTKMVMLTAASDREALIAAMLSGASGYIVKRLRGTDLVGTVRRVAGGELLLDPHAVATVLDELVERRSGENGGRFAGNDAVLLSLLARGMTNAEIEAELDTDHATLTGRVSALVNAISVRHPGVVAHSRTIRNGASG